MVAINTAIVTLGVMTFLIALFWAWTNHRRYKENLLVSRELDRLIGEAMVVAKKGKTLAAEQRELASSLHYAAAEAASPDLSSPAMLSTLITVLVHKYGDVRLSMKDFMIDNDEYVSVYVDAGTQEILLSLDKTLGANKDYVMASMVDTDDNTFH